MEGVGQTYPGDDDAKQPGAEDEGSVDIGPGQLTQHHLGDSEGGEEGQRTDRPTLFMQ